MPRYVPRQLRQGLVPAGVAFDVSGPSGSDAAIQAAAQTQTPRRRGTADPYDPRSGYSFFRDLLRDAEAHARAANALQHPTLRGRDQGEGPLPAGLTADGSLEDVRA